MGLREALRASVTGVSERLPENPCGGRGQKLLNAARADSLLDWRRLSQEGFCGISLALYNIPYKSPESRGKDAWGQISCSDVLQTGAPRHGGMGMCPWWHLNGTGMSLQVDYGGTAEELESHFNSCGQINRVTILCDKFSGHPKGYAYIEFEDKSSVKAAVELDESLFRGRVIKVLPKRTNMPGISTTDRGGSRGRFPSRGGLQGCARIQTGLARGKGSRGLINTSLDTSVSPQ
uniref:RRM domain-containing protein n=1 Tax=Terrapene triunguis TaxID=2587831 RepID=A0A674J037_9SAUR